MAGARSCQTSGETKCTRSPYVAIIHAAYALSVRHKAQTSVSRYIQLGNVQFTRGHAGELARLPTVNLLIIRHLVAQRATLPSGYDGCAQPLRNKLLRHTLKIIIIIIIIIIIYTKVMCIIIILHKKIYYIIIIINNKYNKFYY